MSDRPDAPTLFAWAGGAEALAKLTAVFYDKVLADPLLEPVFSGMSKEHPAHVAQFIGEVLGGPAVYSRERGGHPGMISRHLGKMLDERKRARWMQLLLESADAVGLPSDPEFRSAFVAYIEWGSRLAVTNSQPGAAADADQPMPKWGWGVPGGPYRG
jgi:hemoglobin